MKFLDPHDPFFNRPAARWLPFLLPIAWGLFELLVIGDPLWGLLFLAAGLYAGWMLLVRRPREIRERAEQQDK